jgi:hypothetical protein
LCNTYEGSSEIKSSRNDTYNRQYQTFTQKPKESLDDCFAYFESIVSSLRSCGPLTYSDNERAKQLLYALDDSVWGLKITALEESADFAILDTEKLFSKLKSHKLSRKGHPNYDASLTSKAFITSTRVGGHDANPTNTTVSSALEFGLSSLVAASDKQYESILDDEITILARKFHALHMFRKERRRSPRGCFECSDTTHFIADYTKRKKLDSSNKHDYTKWNDYSKGDDKKKYHFRDKKKKKKFQKMMSRACAALSDLDFSSDDSSNLEEDEKVKRKPDDFTGLCLMGKSSIHISDSDSDVSDDLSPDGLSLRVIELKNALCNQDKLCCKVFCENKKLNLELETASLRSTHDDMSVKPCDNYTMIMVNYADLCLVHSHVASLLDGARLELRELKARSRLLGVYTSYSMLRSDWRLVLFKGKLFHATKENTELKQEVVYLTARLEKTILSEKMIEKDLSKLRRV